MKPNPTICNRIRSETVYGNLLGQGMTPWMADIISKRIDSPVTLESCINPSLSKIVNPSCIPDMDKAVNRIANAIIDGEKVAFCVDHDMDGQGAAAVLWSSFVQHFKVPSERLSVITSHRLSEGYGITNAVVERVLASDATLVISADKGSSDEPRIKQLADAGKDVVVTDHHEVPIEGPPFSALACVNPKRLESQYDPYICGAGVAWLTMAMVRTELLKRGYLIQIPSMSALLDYVAVATVADCVSLRPDLSYINRAFVKHGLSLINAKKRPCWYVFCENFRDNPVTSQTISFQLAPAVAAAGRLDWAESGFRFLIAENKVEAIKHWSILKQENEQRKVIEKELRLRAFDVAAKLNSQSLVLFFEDGHSGVHGITASRLVERFGKPSAIFAPKGAGNRNCIDSVMDNDGRRLASGSFRGISGLHVRDALQHVDNMHPGLMVSFGGHAGAAGATILIDDFERFTTAYEEAVCEQLKQKELKPEIWVDGDIEPSLLTLKTLDELSQLEPWGRDFPLPVFCSEFLVANIKPVGDGSHIKLGLKSNGIVIDAVWFNAIEVGDVSPIAIGQKAKFAYKLDDNVYRENRTLQLQIVALDK